VATLEVRLALVLRMEGAGRAPLRAKTMDSLAAGLFGGYALPSTQPPKEGGERRHRLTVFLSLSLVFLLGPT